MTAVLEQLTPGPTSAILDPLFAALHRLDHLLEDAVARARGIDGAGDDDAGGLKAMSSDALRESGANGAALYTPLAEDSPAAMLSGATRLDWLAHAYDLDPFDLDLVILALAPDVDLRYESLYAYLQGDPARRRPTLGLALELLCSSSAERVARRNHFSSSGSLFRHRLIRFVGDASGAASLLTQQFALDPQIANLLIGVDALDERLTRWCRLTTPDTDDADGLPDAVRDTLPPLLRSAADAAEPCFVYFHGPAGAGKHRASLAAAAAAGLPHLTIDVPGMLASGEDATSLLLLALRDAWLRHAVPYLAGADTLWRDERYAHRVPLRDLLAEQFGPVVLSGMQPWVAGTAGLTGVMAVAIETPDAPARRRLWNSRLSEAGLSVTDTTLDALATRFRLTAAQVTDAATIAAQQLARNESAEPVDIERELFARARAQRGHELAELTTRIPTTHRLDDLVLPEESLAQLREIRQRVVWQERVLDTWGFRERLARGHGVTVLFSGASGTGKTMAADVLATELGLDLYRVELAGVVSKYIGETEKNLDRIFAAAEHSNAILLFDEADALFGKRSEVKDAHDRYANLEVSYLLQRMESYDGIAILATNLRGNLDSAFVRRLAFTVVFPFPEVGSRRRIWERMWPAATPLSSDIDFGVLAERFPLSGGNIRNIALAAAFLAAEAGTEVTLAHILHATGREYQKLGKTLAPEELA